MLLIFGASFLGTIFSPSLMHCTRNPLPPYTVLFTSKCLVLGRPVKPAADDFAAREPTCTVYWTNKHSMIAPLAFPNREVTLGVGQICGAVWACLAGVFQGRQAMEALEMLPEGQQGGVCSGHDWGFGNLLPAR